jgi:hypothetical protein
VSSLLARSQMKHPRSANRHMPPEGVLAVVCLDNPRDNTRGKVLWTSLPSLGPQEECPWRLSDEGILTMTDIRTGVAAACRLPQRTEPLPPVPNIAHSASPSSDVPSKWSATESRGLSGSG